MLILEKNTCENWRQLRFCFMKLGPVSANKTQTADYFCFDGKKIIGPFHWLNPSLDNSTTKTLAT